jgi:probable rRNA maturation factor
MTSIDIQRHSTLWRSQPNVAALVRRAARAGVSGGGVALHRKASIAIALADDAMVRAANRAWRAKDNPTNVLSVPAVPPARLATAPFLGDIIIAHETVAAEAAADGKPFADHLAHLVVHGVLHLLGYDHMTAGDAEIMEARERAILAALGVPDPYAGSQPLES